MAAKRLSMRKLKEVLRLSALGHSDRVIARSLDIGRSTVQRYRHRAEEVELSWPAASELADSELAAAALSRIGSTGWHAAGAGVG